MPGRSGRWIALTVALATVIALLDLLVPRPALAIALVAPPLVAAGRVGPLATAAVAVYSLALAVALGLDADMLLGPAHAVRIGAVAAGGLLAVWVSRLGQRLADSRDQLRAILEGVADAVVARDASGRTIAANRAALDLLGFASEEELVAFPGEPVTDRLEVFTEEGLPMSPGELPGRRASDGESPGAVTVRLRVRATGEERWAVVKASPISGEARAPGLAIVIVEDVTEVKRLERRERLLADAGRVLGESLDYERGLRAVAELAVPALAESCVVHLLDERGAIQLVVAVAADAAIGRELRDVRERYPPDADAGHGVGLALRTGSSTLYREIRPETLERIARDDEHLRRLRELDPRSAMIVPMVSRGRAIGAVSFMSRRTGQRFDDFTLAMAEDLAERMGTAVDNARLYRERSEIARALQESLLPPSLPEVPGVELAARFRAAGAGSEVGGDFYDVFASGPSRWSVVMGDVCGKGAVAAGVTALARYTLRAEAMRDARPSTVLATLNQAMLRQRHDEQFCTVALATLEPDESGAKVTVASGGHPLPLLLRADGSVGDVGRPGTLLGVVDDPELSDESVTMAEGDALVLYTDGVTEGQAPDRIMSSAELADALGDCAGLDAATVAERVERHAVGEREPRDDVAILVLRVRRRDGRSDVSAAEPRLARPRSPAAR